MKVFAPVAGIAESLDFVTDPVFSKRMLGDGIAILPENNQIFSPVAGKIVMLFETKHALGIQSEEGSEFYSTLESIPWNCRVNPFTKQ